MPARRLTYLLTPLLTLILGGCASYGYDFNQVADRLQIGDTATALANFDKIPADSRSIGLHQLERAMLLRRSGDLAASNRSFEEAKRNLTAVESASITEQTTSFMLNDMTRSYGGRGWERLYLHLYAALNYLDLAEFANARVEIMQAATLMRELADRYDNDPLQSSDGFAHLLSGAVFEALGERDQALVSYRHALAAYDSHHEIYPITPPPILGQNLLRISQQLGLQSEYQQYQQRFNPTKEAAEGSRVLWVIAHRGLISRKIEESSGDFSPQLNRWIQIALPAYPATPPPLAPLRLQINQQPVSAERAANLDGLARADLEKSMTAISARALARMVVKYQMAHQAEKEGGALAGMLVSLTAAAVEQADTRGWYTLPREIWLTRIVLPDSATGRIEIHDAQQQPLASRSIDDKSRHIFINLHLGE
jgi:uncharacterized protein